MIELHIGFHGQTHRIAFWDRAAAQAELDKLLPMLGRDKWGSNGKQEQPTHTIATPTGDFAVVLEKVETARLIDTKANDDLYRTEANDAHDENLDRLIKDRLRMQEAGVLRRVDQ